MLEMIYEYKKSLRDAKKMYEKYKKIDPEKITAQQDTDKRIISSMIRDLEYVIKWLKTGRNPDLRRGIDKTDVYTMNPQLIDRIRIDKPEINPRELTQEEKEKMEDAICTLTEREKDIFIMIKADGLTFEYVAELLNIKRSTVQTHFERAEKKIEKRKSESLFLV